MSDIIEAFKLVSGFIGTFAQMDSERRIQTAGTFASLSRTFDAFAPAYRDRNIDAMTKLEAKTRGHLEALKSNENFARVLGTEEAEKFFSAIEKVATAKEFLTLNEEEGRSHIDLIIKAAGYFEGYAEGIEPNINQ